MDVFGGHVCSHILLGLTVQLAVKCHGNCHLHSIIITERCMPMEEVWSLEFRGLPNKVGVANGNEDNVIYLRKFFIDQVCVLCGCKIQTNSYKLLFVSLI